MNAGWGWKPDLGTRIAIARGERKFYDYRERTAEQVRQTLRARRQAAGTWKRCQMPDDAT